MKMPADNIRSFQCVTAFSIVFLCSLSIPVWAQATGTKNPCVVVQSCADCVASAEPCGWCSDPDYSRDRCDTVQNLYAYGCTATEIFTKSNPPPQPEVSSAQCNHHGDQECGLCLCDKGFFGKSCELEGLPSRSDENLEACIMPNSSSKQICSGQGDCISGICDCYPRRANSQQKYSGQYCQCDDYSCYYHQGQLCGEHGRCVCGLCKCDEGFIGEACGCPVSVDSCRSSNGEICNGFGVCECGVCRCDRNSSYMGPTCEDCPTCPGKCVENKNCALCVGFGTGPFTREECEEKCTHVSVTDTIDEETVDADGNLNLCQFFDEEDDCRYFFTYEYASDYQLAVKVQQTKECPSSVNKSGQDGGNGGASTPESRLCFIVMPALCVLAVAMN